MPNIDTGRRITEFDWESNCGNNQTPTDVLIWIAENGLTMAQFAQEYADDWPFAEWPLDDEERDVVICGIMQDLESEQTDHFCGWATCESVEDHRRRKRREEEA